MHAARVVNDPLFINQFYLQPGPVTIDAPAAWDVTVGSPAIVVAVLDTGGTAHADLAGRMLPGYDFVSPQRLSNDATPPDRRQLSRRRRIRSRRLGHRGDIAGAFADTECTARASSWHGTR